MFEHSILSKLHPLKDNRIQGKAIALLASLVLFNHRGGLNVLGKFNDRKDRAVEEVMTQEQATLSLASTDGFLNQKLLEEGAPAKERVLDLEQFKQYQNFWKLMDFLQSPHAIFTTAGSIKFEPLKLEAISQAPKRVDHRKDKGKVNKKVEEDVESGEIVEAGGASIVENLDVHHVRRQMDSRSTSRLLEVLF
mmetsp:Transcript_19402/g.29798  ORF Transcript_19402/g.29798 Transcript_19402/m.29798 type:complete len:193 (+) Transcript_19402:638-1216(+)